MSGAVVGHVFGYGSLVDLPALARFLERPRFYPEEVRLWTLPGFRRIWNIARDNREPTPDRPYYVDPATGDRAGLFVTVVNIRANADADANTGVNGILFPVGDADLARLDHREFNYDRTDISHLTDKAAGLPVWTYIGKPVAEARFARGADAGLAVVNEDYFNRVDAAFASHGEEFYRDFVRSTDLPMVPLKPLILSVSN